MSQSLQLISIHPQYLGSRDVQIFLANLSGLQKKLYKDYHHDRYIRDRLLTAIYIPQIQDPLVERMPRTAQKVIQRTVRRLSDKPKTAWSMIAHIATFETEPS